MKRLIDPSINDGAPKRGAYKATNMAKLEPLLEGLNQDLAGEFQAILMYTTYSALLTGPYRRELRALFQAEITDELGHAQFIADKIAALGGQPTTAPREVSMVTRPREMIEQALAAELQAITDYTARILQAQEYGDIGLKVRLEEQLSDETQHKEELELILNGWPDSLLEETHAENHWDDDGSQ